MIPHFLYDVKVRTIVSMYVYKLFAHLPGICVSNGHKKEGERGRERERAREREKEGR